MLSRGMLNKFRRKKPSCNEKKRPSSKLSRTKIQSGRKGYREKSIRDSWSRRSLPECKVRRKSANRVRCGLLISSKDKRAPILDTREMSLLKEKLN